MTERGRRRSATSSKAIPATLLTHFKEERRGERELAETREDERERSTAEEIGGAGGTGERRLPRQARWGVDRQQIAGWPAVRLAATRRPRTAARYLRGRGGGVLDDQQQRTSPGEGEAEAAGRRPSIRGRRRAVARTAGLAAAGLEARPGEQLADDKRRTAARGAAAGAVAVTAGACEAAAQRRDRQQLDGGDDGRQRRNSRDRQQRRRRQRRQRLDDAGRGATMTATPAAAVVQKAAR
ncbi:hypothetical protein Scep_007799 [Stephania cephalantha]|uniref:Uncharacterized protein n=1 Tax=Stephania cephalantha TaxID=152367 RepID=A0AAP0KD85_9MAGN